MSNGPGVNGTARKRWGETAVLFEEYPIVLLVVIIVVIEAWLRVREPLFHLISRALGRDTSS